MNWANASRVMVALVCVGLAGCGQPEAEATAEGEVRIAAAANLQFALDAIIDDFAEDYPGIEVDVTYGASGNLVQQIDNGAPFDIFLSADRGHAEELVSRGGANEDDLVPYALGKLALWVPNETDVDPADGLDVLSDDEVSTVAIANPDTAPYGAAAVEAMESVGVYTDLEDALVQGESISQTAEFARAGNADVGFIALSQAVSDELADAGSYSEVPEDAYSPIEQVGTVVADPTDDDAASTFMDYLTSDPGHALLEEYGYGLPDAES